VAGRGRLEASFSSVGKSCSIRWLVLSRAVFFPYSCRILAAQLCTLAQFGCFKSLEVGLESRFASLSACVMTVHAPVDTMWFSLLLLAWAISEVCRYPYYMCEFENPAFEVLMVYSDLRFAQLPL
jgi:hypothetical protein